MALWRSSVRTRSAPPFFLNMFVIGRCTLFIIGCIFLFSCGELSFEEQVLQKIEKQKDSNTSLFNFEDDGILVSPDGREFKKINPQNGLLDSIGVNKLGQITYKGSFRNEKPHGDWITFFEDGRPRWMGGKKNGKNHGSYNMWYENGRKKVMGSFKEGKKQGLEISWYDTGIKWHERFFENGMPVGSWKTWDIQGSLVDRKLYSPSLDYNRSVQDL